jgi:hypothetical protein
MADNLHNTPEQLKPMIIRYMNRIYERWNGLKRPGTRQSTSSSSSHCWQRSKRGLPTMMNLFSDPRQCVNSGITWYSDVTVHEKGWLSLERIKTLQSTWFYTIIVDRHCWLLFIVDLSLSQRYWLPLNFTYLKYVIWKYLRLVSYQQNASYTYSMWHIEKHHDFAGVSTTVLSDWREYLLAFTTFKLIHREFIRNHVCRLERWQTFMQSACNVGVGHF